MPAGVTVSGLEADGAGVFYCGGAASARCAPCASPSLTTLTPLISKAL